MMRRALLLLLLAAPAVAQQRPIYDADDFVDPRTRGSVMFVSHLVGGAGANLVDDYRPTQRNGPFFEWANSVYWSSFQVDYKHSRAYTGAPPLQVCACEPPVFFSSGPSNAAPPSSPKETVQFASYLPGGWGTMLRYRVTLTNQNIDTTAQYPGGNSSLTLHGHEQTFGLDADTHFRIGQRDVWGSLVFARNTRSGTADNRAQSELAYTSRFGAIDIGAISVMPRLTVGGVSGRGASGVNVVHPQLDFSYYHHGTQANLHLLYSPVTMRSGAKGWETRHQIALFADRILFAKFFTSAPTSARPQ